MEGKGKISRCVRRVELPWPDVKVAQRLAIGVPCRYMPQNNVTDQFVLTHVVPNIKK